jgi:hypothetical protein
MRQLHLRMLLAASLLSGCSSSQSATPDGTSGAGSLGEAGATGDAGAAGETSSMGNAGASGALPLTGTITVSLRAANETTMAKAFSVAGGTVYDGPVPDAFPLAVSLEEPGCKLLKPKLPFCSDGCGGDAACVDDETCAAYPKAQDVGILRLEGLGGEPVTMDPFPPSFAYQSPALPHPPCVEGEAVSLSGDDFSAASTCIAPLIVASTEFAVRRDEALGLDWEAPAQSDQTRVLIKLDVSHHGGKKGEIDCDVPDTGSFEIPASLVTALVDLGLAGYPTIVLTRIASAPSADQPAIKFEISSSIELEVDTGITSCTEDAQCATDQRCNMDKLVCE